MPFRILQCGVALVALLLNTAIATDFIITAANSHSCFYVVTGEEVLYIIFFPTQCVGENYLDIDAHITQIYVHAQTFYYNLQRWHVVILL